MKIKRLIPCLLLRNNGLVKTVKFRESTYLGDPINTIRIFNEKEVDELVFVDIDATKQGKEPPYDLLNKIASECFMPFAYGGGIKNLNQIEKIIKSGAEKVIINSYAFLQKDFIKEASKLFGSSTIVVSVDAKKEFFGGYKVYIKGGTQNTGKSPAEYARNAEDQGAGEIFLNSIERDGTMLGYDTELVSLVSEKVSIPVIACGGAGKLDDFRSAINAGASAVAAGSFFVFHGKRKAVLITYPSYGEIKKLFSENG
ncbi:MAG TPA: AglZ/HisF2 family acetamidino modification protein [Bacteroidales bacterium]|nr:AglZ/HisF2 family acetamidino modification protein [Bacteroidales bacterium]